MPQVPAASCVSWLSPAKAPGQGPGVVAFRLWRPRQIQLRRPPSSAQASPRSASGGCSPSPRRIWRRWPSCCETETDFGSRTGFLLSWGILNFFWIALLRRPALSGALSLTLVVVLILLSRLKHDIVQMTANFVDLMVIDRDTAAFLFTIFPNLRWSVIGAAFVVIPLMYALWWLDPFRIRRLPAAACALACLAALVGYAFAWPDRSLARLL